MAKLPYTSSPGNIEKALRAIQSAATPPTVSQDFVKTILKIPGGSGNQVASYLKKVGFVNADGSPSDLYKSFRNTATQGKSAATALKEGYKPLYVRNEYMHELSDEKLRGLIVEETGQGDDSNVLGWVVSSIKALKKFAKWHDGKGKSETPDEQRLAAIEPKKPSTTPSADELSRVPGVRRVGLNLSYTINLNLPATADIAVFNALFKSLKENLLRGEADE
ncbi:MAG: DUF5343 domain-containing protein [Bryobacteraceae bacterium]